ncbi:MAG: translation initiation factor IF-2 subunit gamma [Nanoarchaeota archaeon]|nr:translation initiation factor IF-2 subunit gamma [Nanoarchaeota archaeon]MBU4124378.1 translation initiation factor IF-2 subunit gamma [Nanoarchaeota archaeon]
MVYKKYFIDRLHGKSTLVESISGKWPALHSEELKRGITIKLGYADATLYQCKKCGVFSSSDKCGKCFEVCDVVRTVSFVDAPGHETLMATVLAGASLMDGVIFTIAANERCPQPQTQEHLMVLGIVGIKNIIIVQTKIDLVTKEEALENYKQIKEFVKGTVAENAPVIPVSSKQKINLDVLLNAIQEFIPTPERDLTKPVKMYVVRSFDINKPGTEPAKLKGGILGGGIVQGKLDVGDEIEIKPGIKIKDKWQPIKTKVTGLQKAGKDLKTAGAGGLLGVLTELDPYLTKADSLNGSVAGIQLPNTLSTFTMEYNLFDKKKIIAGEILLLNVGTGRTIGTAKMSKGNKCEVVLKTPICTDKSDRVVISRKIEDRWRLSGWAKII